MGINDIFSHQTRKYAPWYLFDESGFRDNLLVPKNASKIAWLSENDDPSPGAPIPHGPVLLCQRPKSIVVKGRLSNTTKGIIKRYMERNKRKLSYTRKEDRPQKEGTKHKKY
jgi:hypothetical protein